MRRSDDKRIKPGHIVHGKRRKWLLKKHAQWLAEGGQPETIINEDAPIAIWAKAHKSRRECTLTPEQFLAKVRIHYTALPTHKRT